jgi:hypothetical protein
MRASGMFGVTDIIRPWSLSGKKENGIFIKIRGPSYIGQTYLGPEWMRAEEKADARHGKMLLDVSLGAIEKMLSSVSR